MYKIEDIKMHAVQYFSAVYMIVQANLKSYLLKGQFPDIDEISLSSFITPVDDSEIKNTIFSMKPLKAPGVDGMHSIFLLDI